MEGPSCDRLLRVKTLDEQHLVGTLLVLEVPPVRLARPDGPRLALELRVNDCRGDEVYVWNRG